MEHPIRLILIAFGLLILGVALLFLIVIGLLISTLPLNLVAYGCSVAGFIVSFVGLAQYRRRDK
jgi:hypothetical protein